MSFKLAIGRERSEIKWREINQAGRKGTVQPYRDGVDRVTYAHGNHVIVATHHPERGENIGPSGIAKVGEWTLDYPSPFRPDSERTRCYLPIAA